MAMESWCGRLCCLMVAALASCFDYRAGLTRTIAGSKLATGYVDGAGTSARFSSIQSVAWTPAANFLVVVESGYNVIRRIDAMSGETITLAGGPNNACVESDGVGSDAQFCRPTHVRMTEDGSTVWVWSSPGGATGRAIRNISVGSGQVPAAPLQCKTATREECRAYASENAPWFLPLAETESCDRPSGCLRAGARDLPSWLWESQTSVIFNTCPNSTTPPPPADTSGMHINTQYTSVCAGGMFSPYHRQSAFEYPRQYVFGRGQSGFVIRRSTWRFAAGFAGDETSVTWYRDPQYRRCE
jgi:hypothetical protein